MPASSAHTIASESNTSYTQRNTHSLITSFRVQSLKKHFRRSTHAHSKQSFNRANIGYWIDGGDDRVPWGKWGQWQTKESLHLMIPSLIKGMHSFV